jgi:hypothetical protein
MSTTHVVWLALDKQLEDSERMLAYAARSGKKIEPEVAETIAESHTALVQGNWTAELHGRLCRAQSRLANAIHPVTAETLDPSSMKEARRLTRHFFRLAFALALVIVPASMVMFASAKISASGKVLVEQNDKLADRLHDALQIQRNSILSAEKHGTTSRYIKTSTMKARADGESSTDRGTVPATDGTIDVDSIQALTPAAIAIKEDLQIFARNNRQLYAETRWLARLSLHRNDNPYDSPWMLSKTSQRENLELTLPMLVRHSETSRTGQENAVPPGPEHSVDDGLQKLAVYQDIRAMAQDAQHTSDFLWAAIAAYVLPVLYAVLGTLAYILRDLCAQARNHTFYASHARFANRARVIVAVIIGTVIGLFDRFMNDSISASPLAIAFAAGYAVDPFFAFLDRYITDVWNVKRSNQRK